MTIEEKFREAAALMETARKMGLVDALSAEDNEARQLWIRLKRGPIQVVDEPAFLDLVEAVADLTAWFKDQAVPGAVIGGLAAALSQEGRAEFLGDR